MQSIPEASADNFLNIKLKTPSQRHLSLLFTSVTHNLIYSNNSEKPFTLFICKQSKMLPLSLPKVLLAQQQMMKDLKFPASLPQIKTLKTSEYTHKMNGEIGKKVIL